MFDPRPHSAVDKKGLRARAPKLELPCNAIADARYERRTEFAGGLGDLEEDYLVLRVNDPLLVPRRSRTGQAGEAFVQSHQPSL
jgi:hypothetical protein